MIKAIYITIILLRGERVMLEYCTILALIDWDKLDKQKRTKANSANYIRVRVLVDQIMNNGDTFVQNNHYNCLLDLKLVLKLVVKSTKKHKD